MAFGRKRPEQSGGSTSKESTRTTSYPQDQDGKAPVSGAAGGCGAGQLTGRAGRRRLWIGRSHDEYAELSMERDEQRFMADRDARKRSGERHD